MNILFLKIFSKNQKKFVGYVILFAFLNLIMFIIFQYNNFVQTQLISTISEQYQNRELYVSDKKTNIDLKDNVAKISKINSIKEILFVSSPKNVLLNGKNYVMEYFLPNHHPRIILGEEPYNKTKNEIIIPNNMVENEINNNFGEIYLEYYNENNELEYMECKVVGIYDSTNAENNKIYISNSSAAILERPEDIGYLVEVDKYKNVDDVLYELDNLNFNANIYDDSLQNELNIYLSLNQIFKFFICIVIIVIILLTYYLINDFISIATNTIALMKVIGYSRFNIMNCLFFMVTLFSIFSYILCLLLVLFAGIILSLFFSFNILVNIKLAIALFFLIILIESLVILFFNQKIKRISIINLLKNCND